MNLSKYCTLENKVEKTSEKQQSKPRREHRTKCYVHLKKYFYLSTKQLSNENGQHNFNLFLTAKPAQIT